MSTPYCLEGSRPSHIGPSRCSGAEHKPVLAANAFCSGQCTISSLFDVQTLVKQKPHMFLVHPDESNHVVYGILYSSIREPKICQMRPKGKWLLLGSHQRYLLGREILILMGFPLHRMTTVSLPENVTWPGNTIGTWCGWKGDVILCCWFRHLRYSTTLEEIRWASVWWWLC